MRLSDDLAASRRLYAAPMIFAPTVMVIDIPPHQAGSGLALDRYYIVMIETDDELAEFEAFLAEDRAFARPPDLLDRRPSCREAGAISFFEFAPPASDWPWILLCHWPRHLARMFVADREALARGAYTMEAFHSRDALRAALRAHVALFGDLAEVRTIPPLSDMAGHAQQRPHASIPALKGTVHVETPLRCKGDTPPGPGQDPMGYLLQGLARMAHRCRRQRRGRSSSIPASPIVHDGRRDMSLPQTIVASGPCARR